MPAKRVMKLVLHQCCRPALTSRIPIQQCRQIWIVLLMVDNCITHSIFRVRTFTLPTFNIYFAVHTATSFMANKFIIRGQSGDAKRFMSSMSLKRVSFDRFLSMFWHSWHCEFKNNNNNNWSRERERGERRETQKKLNMSEWMCCFFVAFNWWQYSKLIE